MPVGSLHDPLLEEASQLILQEGESWRESRRACLPQYDISFSDECFCPLSSLAWLLADSFHLRPLVSGKPHIVSSASRLSLPRRPSIPRFRFRLPLISIGTLSPFFPLPIRFSMPMIASMIVISMVTMPLLAIISRRPRSTIVSTVTPFTARIAGALIAAFVYRSRSMVYATDCDC